jgi:NAD(P)-dependent dehydrogenase (short-subunit alcohol dehydrogenase family)
MNTAGAEETGTPRVALVTGASRGIGAAIAQRFAREGVRVVGVSRTRSVSEAGIEFRRADVSHPADVEQLVEDVVERHGRLDVVVNNAAIEHEATVVDTSPDEWDQVMAVNLRSVFLCSKYAIPHLRRSRGVIVNVASVDGLWAEPALAAYCAAKGGVIALTRAIAIDHGREGVRCMCICPSYVATDMLEQYYDAQPDPAAARAEAAGLHPLGRISTPEEVAAVAVWLSSEEASFATGQAYVLDGGLTAGRPNTHHGVAT